MIKVILFGTLAFFSALAIGATAPAPVTTVQVGGRSLLADTSGMTLYVFDSDKTADSTCYNGCASVWPALTVSATDTIAAPFNVSKRTDGKLQLTLNNRPLYRYAGDKNSGSIKGDGLGGIWHVVPF